MNPMFSSILSVARSVILAGVLVCATAVALPSFAAQNANDDLDATPPTEKAYSIEVSKGKLIHLPSPASAVIAADPTVADVQVVSPTLVYINGKSVGETTVFAVDSKDNEILNAVITVNNNLSKLDKAVKEILPGTNVHFKSVDGALVMEGDVDSPLQAEDVRRIAAPFIRDKQTLVNMLRPRSSNQVMLKVRIAEVDRSEMKTFGISLQNISTTGAFAFGIGQGRAIIDQTTGMVIQATSATTVYGGYHDGSNNLNGVIDALEDNGLVTTLAEPTLMAQSGQAASFLAGGEIPVPAVSGSGSTAQISIAYQPYGVSLNFTPVVLTKNRISLTVSPEVSSLTTTGEVQDAGFTIPAIQTRKASTTVELGSGQSFSIAGLLENDNSNDITKFPFLGDLPVIGALFRSHSFQHNQTELVIIVTPYVVTAVDDPKALRDPTQGLSMANDAQRLLMGKLYKEKPAGEDTPSAIDNVDVPQLNGPAGYVLK
jgi:pilus assembly protein CpaC